MNERHFSVIVLGAGIGGYYAFTELKKHFLQDQKNARICLIDRKPFAQFLPIMHQTVSHRIGPDTGRALLDSLADDRAFTLYASVTRIDAENNTVITSEGPCTFDRLIIALGSDINYFGVPGAEEYSFRVNGLDEALLLRRRLDEAAASPDPLHICIVGGSYTGVEVAGEIAWRLRKRPCHTVHIIDSNTSILSTMNTHARHLVNRKLARLGVHIHTNTRIAGVENDCLITADGKRLPSHITVWAGGCKNIGSDVYKDGALPSGRLGVDAFLRVQKTLHIYAIGDISGATHGSRGCPLPQNGSIAHEQALYVARHIRQTHKNIATAPFQHKTADTTVMSVGPWYGICTYHAFAFGGKIPWLIRQAIYMLFLPTVKNKWRFLREFWIGE
jgi:NADH:ubiquinone reductase (H+-translocating)